MQNGKKEGTSQNGGLHDKKYNHLCYGNTPFTFRI